MNNKRNVISIRKKITSIIKLRAWAFSNLSIVLFKHLFFSSSILLDLLLSLSLLILNYIFDFIKILNLEKKIHLKRTSGGVISAFLFGMGFAAGWSPCIGPILASILFYAGTSEHALQGGFLLIAFSAGLGTPFIIASLFFSFFCPYKR